MLLDFTIPNNKIKHPRKFSWKEGLHDVWYIFLLSFLSPFLVVCFSFVFVSVYVVPKLHTNPFHGQKGDHFCIGCNCSGKSYCFICFPRKLYNNGFFLGFCFLSFLKFDDKFSISMKVLSDFQLYYTHC
jgi:hypothetical protein